MTRTIDDMRKEVRDYFNAFSPEYEELLHNHGDAVIDFILSRYICVPRDAVPEELAAALGEIRPLYERSLKRIEEENKFFVGMNKDRPKKGACDFIFEAAALLAQEGGAK